MSIIGNVLRLRCGLGGGAAEPGITMFMCPDVGICGAIGLRAEIGPGIIERRDEGRLLRSEGLSCTDTVVGAATEGAASSTPSSSASRGLHDPHTVPAPVLLQSAASV